MRSRPTYQLHSVLPELGLLGLIEKWKRPDMVYEQVAQYGELRILWRHFSLVTSERCTKAAERCWRVQLLDLISDLVADQLALEVCNRVSIGLTG
jgi:hypothetical protein